MNRNQIAAILQRLGTKAKPGGGKMVSASCPLGPWKHKSGVDSNPSFGVYIKPGIPYTKCFGCGWYGDLRDLVMEIAVLQRGEQNPKIDTKTVFGIISEIEENAPLALLEEPEEVPEVGLHPFPEDWLESFGKAYDHPYLQARKGGAITEPVAAYMDFRYDFTRKRICAPVRDYGGVLVGLHGRLVEPPVKDGPPPYLMYTHQKRNNPFVWLGEHHIDWERPLLLVESLFDYARALHVYDNVATPLTASLSNDKLKRIADATHIVTFFDNDARGKDAHDRVVEFLSDSVIEKVPYLTEHKDPGDMTAKIFRAHVSDFLPLSK